MTQPPESNHPSSHGKNARQLQMELDQARKQFPVGTLYVIPRSGEVTKDVVGEIHHVFRAGNLELCASLLVQQKANTGWWDLPIHEYLEPRVPLSALRKIEV